MADAFLGAQIVHGSLFVIAQGTAC